jgi:plasmid stabilization system protein ParE
VKALQFHPEAAAELEFEARFYNERVQGLGVRFVSQVEQALQLMRAMPGIGTTYLADTRRVFPKDFPHSIVYREGDDKIIVYAIAPFKRKPGYWRNRV